MIIEKVIKRVCGYDVDILIVITLYNSYRKSPFKFKL